MDFQVFLTSIFPEAFVVVVVDIFDSLAIEDTRISSEKRLTLKEYYSTSWQEIRLPVFKCAEFARVPNLIIFHLI